MTSTGALQKRKKRWFENMGNCQIAGALTGALLTISVPLVHWLSEPFQTEHVPIDFAAVLGMVVFWPAWKVFSLFGWQCAIYTERGFSMATLVAVTLFNSCLLFVVGTAVCVYIRSVVEKKPDN